MANRTYPAHFFVLACLQHRLFRKKATTTWKQFDLVLHLLAATIALMHYFHPGKSVLNIWTVWWWLRIGNYPWKLSNFPIIWSAIFDQIWWALSFEMIGSKFHSFGQPILYEKIELKKKRTFWFTQIIWFAEIFGKMMSDFLKLRILM